MDKQQRKRASFVLDQRSHHHHHHHRASQYLGKLLSLGGRSNRASYSGGSSSSSSPPADWTLSDSFVKAQLPVVRRREKASNGKARQQQRPFSISGPVVMERERR